MCSFPDKYHKSGSTLLTVFRLYGRYDLTCGMKNISMNRTLILLTGILLCLWAPQLQAATLRQQMQWLHEHYGVNFIYDSSLELDVPYEGSPLAEISAETEEEALKKCLDSLFEGSGIKWTINRKYIVLTKVGKKPKDYAIFFDEQCDTLEEARITAFLGPASCSFLSLHQRNQRSRLLCRRFGQGKRAYTRSMISMHMRPLW